MAGFWSLWAAVCFKRSLSPSRQFYSLPVMKLSKKCIRGCTLWPETVCSVDLGVPAGVIYLIPMLTECFRDLLLTCQILVVGFWAIHQTADPLIQVNLCVPICVTEMESGLQTADELSLKNCGNTAVPGVFATRLWAKYQLKKAFFWKKARVLLTLACFNSHEFFLQLLCKKQKVHMVAEKHYLSKF